MIEKGDLINFVHLTLYLGEYSYDMPYTLECLLYSDKASRFVA